MLKVARSEPLMVTRSSMSWERTAGSARATATSPASSSARPPPGPAPFRRRLEGRRGRARWARRRAAASVWRQRLRWTSWRKGKWGEGIGDEAPAVEPTWWHAIIPPTPALIHQLQTLPTRQRFTLEEVLEVGGLGQVGKVRPVRFRLRLRGVAFSKGFAHAGQYLYFVFNVNVSLGLIELFDFNDGENDVDVGPFKEDVEIGRHGPF